MNTPWGIADGQDKITRGVTFVTTPGHGGLMIAKGFAEKHLSESACKRGEVYGGYYAYEEDCAYAIPMFELLEAYYEEFSSAYTKKRSLEAWKDALLDSLSRWNPDYLLEIGVTPKEEFYAIWRKDQARDKMRREKHPDFIIAALRQDDGSVKVWTADDKEYFVTKESYQQSDQLLSNCETFVS